MPASWEFKKLPIKSPPYLAIWLFGVRLSIWLYSGWVLLKNLILDKHYSYGHQENNNNKINNHSGKNSIEADLLGRFTWSLLLVFQALIPPCKTSILITTTINCNLLQQTLCRKKMKRYTLGIFNSSNWWRGTAQGQAKLRRLRAG